MTKQKKCKVTFKQLPSLITKREGKKHQASIGDVREILGILSDILWDVYNTSPATLDDIVCGFLTNGEKRAMKVKRKK